MVHMNHEEPVLPSPELLTLLLPEGRIRIILTAWKAFRKAPDNLCEVFMSCSYLESRNPLQDLPCH